MEVTLVVVIAMALLQRRPAQDTQVHQEAEVEDSLVEVVVEVVEVVEEEVVLEVVEVVEEGENLAPMSAQREGGVR